MSTNTNEKGTNIHSNEFIVLPVTALDTQIETLMFSYPELDVGGVPTGVTLYHSIRSHEQATATRKIMYTADQLYAFYGMTMSDLKNDTKDFKAFAKTAGLVLGGDDFTAMVGSEFWVINNPELNEWLAVSPHNVTVEATP